MVVLLLFLFLFWHVAKYIKEKRKKNNKKFYFTLISTGPKEHDLFQMHFLVFKIMCAFSRKTSLLL